MYNLTTANVSVLFYSYVNSVVLLVYSCVAIVKAMTVMLNVAWTRSTSQLSVKWSALKRSGTWLVLLHSLSLALDALVHSELLLSVCLSDSYCTILSLADVCTAPQNSLQCRYYVQIPQRRCIRLELKLNRSLPWGGFVMWSVSQREWWLCLERTGPGHVCISLGHLRYVCFPQRKVDTRWMIIC